MPISDEQMAVYIDEYLRRRCKRMDEDEKKATKKLLKDGSKSFLVNWKQNDSFESAARNTILPINQGKSTSIQRLKEFHKYLCEQANCEIPVAWPQIDVSSKVEQLMAVALYMQDHVFDTQAEMVEALEEKLWIGEKTVGDAIRSLKNPDEMETESIFSRILRKSVFFDDDRHVMKFLSSAHPVFLMENLTGIIYSLEALLEKANDPLFHDWIMHTAGHIWMQLTDYAKEKILKRIVVDYQEKPQLLALLHELTAQERSEGFVSERYMAQTTINQLLYNYKAGIRCSVIVLKDKEEIVHTGMLKDYDGERLRMETHDGQVWFSPNDVINVTESK